MDLVPLREIASVVRGVTFSKTEAFSEPAEGLLPVVRAGNIQDRLLLDDDLVYVPRARIDEKQLLRQGDIVICTSSGSADVVGKTAVVEEDWRGSFGAFCASIRAKPKKCDPRYLFYYLRSPAFRSWTQQSAGANIKNIRKSELDQFEVPLPDIAAQRRIAAILDKADGIRRQREQAQAMSDELLKSTFLEMFGRPHHPNPALRVLPLGEICDLFAGNSLPPGEAYSGQDTGLLLLKVADLNLPGNDQIVTTAREWVSEKGSTRAAIVAPKNAIVFPKRGGAIATNKKRVLGRPSVLDPNLMAVAPKKGAPITYPYLRMWFELLDLTSISNGSTVPQLNKGDLHPLKMAVPERVTLAAFERVFQGVRHVRHKHAADTVCSEALFSTLSQRAFRGEL